MYLRMPIIRSKLTAEERTRVSVSIQNSKMDHGEYLAILERIAQLEQRQRFLAARILAVRYRRLLILRQMGVTTATAQRATEEVEGDNPSDSDDEIDSRADTESVHSDSTYIFSDSESTDEDSDCIIEMDCYCENCPKKAKLDRRGTQV